MEREEFGELVNASVQTLYRVAKSYLKNDTDCEDAAAQAVAIAFSKLHTLRNDAYAKTWLTRILINECCRMLRTQREVSVAEIGDVEQRGDDYSEVYLALTQLPDRLRIPTVLYYIEGFTTMEIARVEGIPQGTVKSRLSQARHELRAILEDKGDEYHENERIFDEKLSADAGRVCR